MKRIHVLGLALWRGGILLVGGYLLYVGLRVVLPISDPMLELGVGLLAVGLVLVLASLVGERIVDARREREEGLWSD